MQSEVLEDALAVGSMREASVAGKRVTIIGAARSGVAAAQLLKEKGAMVFVSDSGPEEKLRSQIANLQSLGIEFELGNHSDRALDADLLVLSPGVPRSAPMVQEARRRRIRIVSE